MRRELTLTKMAVMLIALSGGMTACGAPAINFLPPTPDDGAIVTGSSVEIEAQILEPALSSVTFNWAGTDYPIYDASVVLMFNCDNVLALGEDYTTPGGLVADASNWLNNGTVGIGDDPESVPEWLSGGRYGGAFDFAGNGSTYGQSILVIPHDESLNPGGGDFAIAMWVRPRSDIDGDLLRKGSTNTASTWYKLEHSPGDESNRFSLNFNTDGTDATVNSPQGYNDDQWHYVLAQRRGSTAELWIDGSLEGSAGVSGNISNNANLTVGSKDTQNDDFINATLDEVRLYMRSFTEDEIQVLYNSNLSKAGPDAWYFYVNQTNLAAGDYAYEVSATNASSSSTASRSVTMDAPPVTANIIKGPYLQQLTDSSIVIMWETDVAVESRVDYGLAAPDEYFVEDLTPVTIHEMALTGLSADTVYYYTVTSGTTTSPASTFGTAPEEPRSFRFVAYGDTRSQPTEHGNVITAIINSAPEFVLHTGDLVGNGDDYNVWQTEFFDPAYDLMIYTPMLPIIGNHEASGNLFRDFFSLGDNDDWFAFTYGPVRFIGLNTHNASYSPGSTQYSWLETELQSPEYTDATWHVVYFHHPPYTATSSHGDDMNVQNYLVPLFELYGVDIVFNGHSHAYERYFHNGIYYIVTGGGGAPLASLVTDNQEPIRQVGESVYHHCAVDVDFENSSLTVSARYNSGVEFDGITIAKTPKATNPNPADGATGVDIGAVLSWSPGIDAVSHDVYFGTADPPAFIQNQPGTTYDPLGLEPATVYYWRIDERDSGGGVTSGDPWSFTTAPVPGQASNPNPSDGAADVSTDADLSWTAGNDVTSHDVYFGTDSNPPLVSQGQTGTTYDPGILAYKTGYYWRIDEIGPGGATEGPEWSFTTKAEMPWSDDFESGDLAAGGWTVSGIADASTKAAYSGVYGAEIKDSAWIEKAISTAGFADIHVKYARSTKGMDSGEYLYVEWWDGIAWNQLEATQDTSWASQDMLCGPAANDNPAFKLRFRSNAGNPSEAGYIDDVEVTGTPAVPFHDVAVIAMTAPASVVAGDTATIDVTVENQGTFDETFDVTLTDTPPQGGTAGAVADSPQMIFLGPGASTTVSFTWDTTGATLGDHSLDATVGPVTGETDTEDNSMSTVVPVGSAITDIGITAVSAPSPVVQGNVVNVDVTVENVGNQSVSSDISVTLTDETDLATVGTETIVGGLAVGASTVLTYSWDTSSATIGDHMLVASNEFADDNAGNDSMSTTSTVTEAGSTIHVQSIDVDLEQAGKNYKGIATVVVSQAQPGGSVVGNWHLGTAGTTDDKLIQEGATGITDGTGTAVIISVPKKAKSGEQFTFVVTDVIVSGYTYAPDDNVETQDSITVQ